MSTNIKMDFWWNIGETTWLVLAANIFMHDLLSNRTRRPQSPTASSPTMADALAS